jgi:hypothetical protein
MNFLIFIGVLRWPAYLHSQVTYQTRYLFLIILALYLLKIINYSNNIIKNS